MPDEVRTNRGSLKCLRSLARLMLIADWLKSRFSAVWDTLLVLFNSVTTASSFRSMLVTPETPLDYRGPPKSGSAYHRNACIVSRGLQARKRLVPCSYVRSYGRRRPGSWRNPNVAGSGKSGPQCMHFGAFSSSCLIRIIKPLLIG